MKFIGETQFATGQWVGIALDKPEGKNDGTVNGVQYFGCKDLHGLFVKKVQCKLDRSLTKRTAQSDYGENDADETVRKGEDETSKNATKMEREIAENNANTELKLIGKCTFQRGSDRVSDSSDEHHNEIDNGDKNNSSNSKEEQQLLENRIKELHMNVETLIMDKEHLSIELELAEERLRLLSSEKASWISMDVSSSDKNENIRLKDALERARETHGREIGALKQMLSDMNDPVTSEETLENSKLFEASQTTNNINQSKNSNDLESIMEQLSIKNVEMVSKIKSLESSIVDLEAGQEIDAEIERAQRIEIEMLNEKYLGNLIQLEVYEKRVQELKSELQKVNNTCDKYKMLLRKAQFTQLENLTDETVGVEGSLKRENFIISKSIAQFSDFLDGNSSTRCRTLYFLHCYGLHDQWELEMRNKFFDQIVPIREIPSMHHSLAAQEKVLVSARFALRGSQIAKQILRELFFHPPSNDMRTDPLNFQLFCQISSTLMRMTSISLQSLYLCCELVHDHRLLTEIVPSFMSSLSSLNVHMDRISKALKTLCIESHHSCESNKFDEPLFTSYEGAMIFEEFLDNFDLAGYKKDFISLRKNIFFEDRIVPHDEQLFIMLESLNDIFLVLMGFLRFVSISRVTLSVMDSALRQGRHYHKFCIFSLHSIRLFLFNHIDESLI